MTTPRRGRLDDAPLEQLFPDSGEDDFALVRHAAARTAEACPPGIPLEWEWGPESLSTEITVYDEAGDRLSFLLDADCSGEFCDSVYLAVNVACGCAERHTTHVLDADTVLLTELADYQAFALGFAFDLMAQRLTGWLKDEGTHTPAHWRSKAGLPAPGSLPSSAQGRDAGVTTA
ncbi:hypothetical protein [Streptomyces sp. NPDC058989]|uniref:hypothetical protein n=1 Tax=Streptomyces sp. NPDC058989 TaxID=3346686 RepID=UPI0036C3A259